MRRLYGDHVRASTVRYVSAVLHLTLNVSTFVVSILSDVFL